MSTPLPLNEVPFYNTDTIANSLSADSMFDTYLEKVPGVGFVTRRRPGLKQFSDLATGVQGDGLFSWEASGKVIAVSNGKAFELAADGTATDITGASLNAGVPVVFADGQATDGTPWLYMATGKLVYSINGGNTTFPVYQGQKVITANYTGFATLVHDASWSLSTSHGPTAEDGVIVTITNPTTIDYSTLTATVTGTDIYDAVQTESIALPASQGTTRTTSYFKTVTSITPSATIGSGTANASGFAAAVTGATWTLTSTAPTDGHERLVTITGLTATDHSGLSATITGTDANDLVQTETVTLPNGAVAVTSTYYFKTVTNVSPSETIGADTMNIGWNAYGGLELGWSDASVELTSSNVPAATHVAYIKGNFLANEPDTNRFDFTDTNPITGIMDNAYWGSTDNPLTCDAKGDKLLAIFAAWQELYACGTNGIEIWQNDGVTPYSPIAGAFTEGGIEAPYSVVVADNTVFMLCVIGGNRVAVKFQGRAPVACSDAIGRILAEMETISDAVGDLIGVGGLAMWLLTFPTAKQSWAYDYKNDVWVRWGYWNASSGEHEHFLGQHTCFVKAWNKHLIMSRVDGKIYELDRATFNDDGNEMVSYRRTGWLNHGTYNRKVCDQFYVKCKAGASNIGTLILRFRDEGNEEWSNWITVPLQPVGQRDFLAKMNRFGMYRSRQYEFRLTDDADLVLVGVDTELRGLSS
jgi:hypothetical protein